MKTPKPKKEEVCMLVSYFDFAATYFTNMIYYIVQIKKINT